MLALGSAYRRKLGVKEGAYLGSSDGFLEVTVYGTEYFIRQRPDGKVMSITHREA